MTDTCNPGEAKTKSLLDGAGFKLHTVMTAAAFHETVMVGTTEDEKGEFTFPPGQSLKGRLWDVLMTLRMGIVHLPPGEDRVNFQVIVFDGKNMVRVKLWALVGPGDDGEPVLTIMLEGED